MTFNSLEFLFFLPLVLALYHVMNHRMQNRMLLLASYFFYGWWDVRFLFLIVVSTAIDFVCGLSIAKRNVSLKQRMLISAYVFGSAFAFIAVPWSAHNTHILSSWEQLSQTLAQTDLNALWITLASITAANLLYTPLSKLSEDKRRKAFVWTSVIANMSILGFFKYFNFFAGSLEQAVGAMGVDPQLLRLDIILPVGISFYTFQTMSYAIDIYRRKLEPTDRFLDFALFVSYFPQLVAGPIERASELLPRILKPRKIQFQQFTEGSYLILWGLFKKVAIADGVAGSVDSIYLSSGVASWIDVVAATFLFAVQIYCDFSGYTDIARGVSKLMGIDLMLNFNQPYFSTNPSEFWRRWHISLSSWLRDYLYIPLGGNRGGAYKMYRNLMITMILGGFWHGAAWNFVLWGFFQGAILCIHSVLFKKTNAKTVTPGSTAPPVFALAKRIAVTLFFFTVTCYGWLLFRAVSLEQVATFSATLFTDIGNMSLSMSRPALPALFGLPILVGIELLQYRYGDAMFQFRLVRPIRAVLYASTIFLICMGMSNAPAQFIYFQF
jgi:alginate O-acetyltransferase complex protein AlgI